MAIFIRERYQIVWNISLDSFNKMNAKFSSIFNFISLKVEVILQSKNCFSTLPLKHSLIWGRRRLKNNNNLDLIWIYSNLDLNTLAKQLTNYFNFFSFKFKLVNIPVGG